MACFACSKHKCPRQLQRLTCCRCITLLLLVPLVQKRCENGRHAFAILLKQRLGTAT